MVKPNEIVFLLLLVYDVTSREIKCPSICECNIFEKYRRATCRNRNLISVEADIPPQVELLDLSYNLIIELNDHIFVDLQLTSMKLLNLSHNKLSQIHMNAFSDINKIKTIDLSYNNIEFLLVHWFWNLPILEELYLQGNNLRKFHEEPVLESKSIKTLDFSSCSLLHIHEDAFSKLPNLEVLNLSKNSLIQLNVNVIKHLPNLKILNLQNNTWRCDDMTNLINYCTDKGIRCRDVCVQPSSTKIETFQRMVVQPHTDIDEPQNVWIYDDDKDTDKKNQTTVNDKCSNANNTDIINKDLLIEIIELSPILSLIIPFLFGLTLGLIISCGVTMKIPKKKQKQKSLHRRTSIIRNRRMNDLSDPLVQPESFEVCDSTPIQLRKNIFNSSVRSEGFM